MKKRLIFTDIIAQINHKNALVITGMRQVGKTTVMKQVFEEIASQKKLWLDLDNPLEQKIFEDIEYKNIYKRLDEMAGGNNERLYIFIDEIQNFPKITNVIKYLIDHYNVKFVVTGSSNFYLKNLFPESLSGRKFLYYLPPMNFREYLYFADYISDKEARQTDIHERIRQKNIFAFKKYELAYEQYLQFGGFPEVVTTKDPPTKKQLLKNIFTSFFEKDLIALSDYKDIRELRDLILLLVPRVGSLLDVTKLASELGADRPKVYGYLEFLQGTFFIKLLSKFSKSIDRSVAGGRKVYFADTGILNSIGAVNEAQLFENAVINQLSNYGEVAFYSKRNTAEIDAVLNKEIACEIKLRGTEGDYKKLVRLAHKLSIEKTYIISKTFSEKSVRIPALFL